MYASRSEGCHFLLAVFSINSYLDSPRHRLPLSSSRLVELGECRIRYREDRSKAECRHRYCADRSKALVVDTITLRFRRLVVMHAWGVREGYRTQQYWADAACVVMLLFSAHSNACASHDVWNPYPDACFARRCVRNRTPTCPKMGLRFRLEAVPKMIPGIRKNWVKIWPFSG